MQELTWYAVWEFTWRDWIGTAGAAAILLAFLFNLLGIWRTKQPIYSLVNFAGAAAVAYSLLYRPNPAAFAVELLWAVTSLIGLAMPEWLHGDDEGPEEPLTEEDIPNPTIWSRIWPPSLWRDRQRRRFNAMRRRRAWRLFDTASSSVAALAEEIRANPPNSIQQGILLGQELRSIRHMLGSTRDAENERVVTEGALACVAPSTATALTDLFISAEAGADRIGRGLDDRRAAEMAEETTPPATEAEAAERLNPLVVEFLSGLNALRRVLEAQRRTLAVWAPAAGTNPSPVGSRQSRQPAPRRNDGAADADRSPPEETDEDRKLTPDEAALLANVTEKFYGSWAFRIVGFALVAAAFLAGAGSLFLGEHTLTLREDLEKAAKRGEEEIKGHTKILQDSIDKQMDALHVTTTEIQSKKEDFERQLTAGKERIDKDINDFTAKSEELKRQIAETVVRQLDEQLKDPLSTITSQIKQNGDAAQKQIDRAASDALTPLTKQGSDIADRLRQLRETLMTDETELSKQAPTLARLNEVGTKLNETEKLLNQVQAQRDELKGSVNQAAAQAIVASSQAATATDAAKSATKAQNNAEAAVRSINDGAADQQRALGRVSGRVEDFNTEIDKFNRQLDGLKAQLKSGLPVTLDAAALTQVVNPITTRLTKVEGRLDHLPAPADIGPLTARMTKVEDRLDHLPAPPAPTNIAPLTARVTKIEDRLDHLPAPPAPTDIAPLTVRLTKVEDRLDHLPAPPAPTDIAPLTVRVTKVEDGLAKVEDRMDHPAAQPAPAPYFPATEGDSSSDQKKQIQRALNMPEREIDGQIGPKTRLAIAAYRRSKNLTAAGPLTAGEIKALLSAGNP